MDIRKVSVGVDYKSAMHYVVGQSVLDGTHSIHAIRKLDTGAIEIYVETEANEVLLWKEVTSTMPCVIECNINF